ncbi:restriction endonuclease subunit S [Clostridium perfringens]|nr:restriction endonuclease subunit S [Clostridium perfringens]
MLKNVKLKELGEIYTGSTPSKKNKEFYNSEDIMFIKPDILDFDIVNIGVSNEYISEKAREKARIIPANSLLVSCIGSIGKLGINEKEVAFNQQINAIVPNNKIKSSRYLAYLLKYNQKKLESIANAPVVPIINKTQFSEFEVLIHEDLNFQEQITQILDKSKEIIEKRKEQIQFLDKLVKSKFIEMFGDPINNPMKWEVKKMKDISVNIMSGNTPKGGEQVYVESGIMFLRSQNVWKNKLLLDDVAYIDQATHNKMKKSSLKNRDILMTKTGRINTENSSLGRAAMFLGEDDSANINGHVYLIRLQEQIINEFVLYILTSKEYRGYIRSVCVGGIDKRQLNKEHIEDFPIIFPPIEKQKKFVSYVNQVDKLKFEIERV